MEETKNKCCCPCHSMMGIFVILFGLAFLLGALEVISQKTLSISWPVIVILAGFKKMCPNLCKCCKGSCEVKK